MPWYYYSGNISRPVPVKKGLSVSVRPHSKVEISEPNLTEIQALLRKGLLRRTGRPAGATSLVKEAPVVVKGDIEKVTKKSELASRIAEKGVTGDPGKAPKKRKGKPELTEGELTPPVDKRSETKTSSKKVKSDVGNSGGSVVGDESVEVLSEVASSGEEDVKKKKKKGRSKG